MILAGCSENQPFDASNSLTGVARITIEEARGMDKIVTGISNEKLLEWEKSHSYKSYYRHWIEANEAFALVDSEQRLQQFLTSNADILIMEGDRLFPKIQGVIYQISCNRQGFYQTGNVINRIVGSDIYYVKADEWSRLLAIQPGAEAPANGGKVSTLLSNENNINAKIQATCTGFGMKDDVLYDVSGCQNDRKAWIEMYPGVWSYSEIIQTENGDDFYLNYRTPTIAWKVWGERKNVFCGWNAYNTQLEYRSVSYTGTGYDIYDFDFEAGYIVRTYSSPVTLSATIPNYITPGDDAFSIESIEFLGDEMVNEPKFIPAPTVMKGQGKSRGVGNQWAIVSCQ
jgi:hypothetical protein